MRRNRDGERRRSRGRGWDQIVLMLILWFIPIGLFGYVGYTIMSVTGHDMDEYLPTPEIWQVALFLALVVGALGGFVAYRLNATRGEAGGRRGRWDSYNTPYESKN